MRQWMKIGFCFLLGMIFVNLFIMDQVFANENLCKKNFLEESSVTESQKQAVLDVETMTFSLESAEDEENVASKGMILTASGIAPDISPEALTKSDKVFKEAAAISEGSKIELTVGEKIYYGNYSTNYFDVNGKPAYCLEPLKDTPNSGSYETHALTEGAVRKGLYYAYGGPGYELYRAKYGAIGIGENYSVNDEYCMSHCILSYLYMGTDEAFVGLSQQVIENLKQKVKNIENMPNPPESFYAFLFNLNSDGQTMGGSGKDRVGSIEIYKDSDHPEWTKGNTCYSLAGAVFGIYESGKDKLLWELTTDESGYAKKENIPIGNYDIRELKAPAGHAIQFKPQSIRIDENKVCTYKCTDQAQYYPIDLILQKKDKETDQSEAQGAATLEDAQFSIKYYSGYYEKNPADSGVTPVREWIMKTDSEGRIRMKEEQKVSGDPFYKNTEGEVVLPLGTVTFQEIKAPEGYLLNNEIFIETVREEGTGQTDTIFQCPTIPDQIIRGNLQIVKFREDKEEESEQGEQKVPLEGIVFTITSKTTGWQCEIVTDENGYASTFRQGEEQQKGGLVYDTYIVSEKKAPEGLTPVGDFEITIEEDAKTLYYILENKKIFSPVKLVKKDSETEKIIPIAGAAFRLLDKDKKPITMTTHYPNESVCDIFRTDENGSFVLPEKLPVGNYYFQEVEAPQGYLIEKKLIPFIIIENHDWEQPFIVESKDRPAKGCIHIQKNDSVTGKGIPGVEFEIKASEDICTPDGTVRVKKGTLVETLVTDESGNARSNELYLGAYEITETKQAEGYILPEKSIRIVLEYEGQDVPVVTKEAEILNQPTSVVIRKIDGETKKALSGVKFELQEKISEVNKESGEEEEEQEKETTYVTDENGEIHLSYLRPGSYCLYESEPLTGYMKTDEVWEFQITDDGMIEGEREKNLEIKNDHTRIADTHAFWKESKAKAIIAGEEHIICDTVKFKYMETNASYTMKGILMDADTGKELLQDGKPITSEKTFKGKDAKDGITMEFDVDSRKFPGKRIVVFEVLYLGDCLIDAHRDLRNQEQTVSILEKEEITVKTGDSNVHMIQTALMMSASVCILYIVGKRKKRRC